MVAAGKQRQGKVQGKKTTPATTPARRLSNQRLSAPELVKLLLTVEETAHKLAVGRSAVYGLMRRGELRYITVGRVRRVPVEAVSEYVSRALGRSVA